jgi:hypothetical protein
MKKLLMGSIVLTLFAMSIFLVQTSCSKSNAQVNSSTNQVGKIVFLKGEGIYSTIWTANNDGTNQVLVPITLPVNVVMDASVSSKSLSVSPDGQKIFFTALDTTVSTARVLSIYSCDLNGSNFGVVVQGTNSLSDIPHHPVAF